MNYKSTGTGLSCCRVGLFRVTTRHRIDCFSIVLLFLAIDQQKCLLFLRNPTQKKKKTKRNGCATIFVKSQMHILVLSYIKSSTRNRNTFSPSIIFSAQVRIQPLYWFNYRHHVDDLRPERFFMCFIRSPVHFGSLCVLHLSGIIQCIEIFLEQWSWEVLQRDISDKEQKIQVAHVDLFQH